jgi:exopolyphosphatase / guanosine-5'-triphosphate,3'-diphosphate pyrophosphatase
VLVRSHRRRFSKSLFAQIPDDQRETVMRVSILLRLAVLLHRTREVRNNLKIQAIRANGSCLDLTFPEGALDQHPLTRADLETEQNFLKAGGVELTFS